MICERYGRNYRQRKYMGVDAKGRSKRANRKKSLIFAA